MALRIQPILSTLQEITCNGSELKQRWNGGEKSGKQNRPTSCAAYVPSVKWRTSGRHSALRNQKVAARHVKQEGSHMQSRSRRCLGRWSTTQKIHSGARDMVNSLTTSLISR